MDIRYDECRNITTIEINGKLTTENFQELIDEAVARVLNPPEKHPILTDTTKKPKFNFSLLSTSSDFVGLGIYNEHK